MATLDDGQRSKGQRWILPEVVVDVEPYNEFPEQDPEQALDEAGARARGATSTKDPVWILGEGVPPCRMTPGPFLLLRETGGGGPRYERVVRVLDGACPKQGRSDRAVAFQDANPPSSCRLYSQQWMEERPPPDGIIPRKPCEPPGCEHKQLVTGGGIGRGTVLEITSTWLYPTEEDECSWAHDDFFGVFVQSAPGTPFVKLEDMWELFGALADDQGLRAVIGDSMWVMSFVPIGPSGRPDKAFRVRTQVAHDEERVWNSLAPYCGP
ncbi:hypothetical protein [Sorangium sp. So ce1024]|uniref:hypothetical protein n=1 Tax=unclassified Sorangium TaxID=2621164 RepID=UPI003F0561FA